MNSVNSSSDANERKRLITKLPALIRKEIRSATLFAHAVAKSSGLHTTDIRCLDFLSERGSATAGDLAKVTGLTTGAITATVNRMERAGLVQRTTDANDRRKVVVEILKGHFNRLQTTRELFAIGIPSILSEYKESELRTIIDWNTRLTSLLQDKAGEASNDRTRTKRVTR